MIQYVVGGPADTTQGNSRSGASRNWWLWDLWLCLAVALAGGLLAPLSDPDFPMHLLTGQWILERGAVPFVELFAWTRAGAPYFAYSWLPEVAYAFSWDRWGTNGVAFVHAVAVALSVLAMWDLSRVDRWSTWATRLILSVHLTLWLLVQGAPRPQVVLALAIPMAWSAAIRIRDGHQLRRAALTAVGAAAMAVNSHLLFPLTLAPIVVVIGQRDRWLQWSALFAAANVIGWLCSPYATSLLDILRLYLGANALLGPASPITELEPGFAMLTHAAVGTRILAGLLLLLPLLPPIARTPDRARLLLGVSWLCGLALFGLAVRGLLLWWLLALPWLGLVMSAIPTPNSHMIYRAVVSIWIFGLSSAPFQLAQMHEPVPVGDLPHPARSTLAPLVALLDCTRTSAPGNSGPASTRGTTVFDYGSYLAWRLPNVSWSIDGRSIFPDSVARADARQELRLGPLVSPPWRSADLVVLPIAHATNLDIARDTAWMEMTPATSEIRAWVKRAPASASRTGCVNTAVRP